jgi:hypothetical protein
MTSSDTLRLWSTSIIEEVIRGHVRGRFLLGPNPRKLVVDFGQNPRR